MHSFCLAFGLSVYEYRDPTITFFTLVRLAMGDFDFEALYMTNRLLGPVLFLLYCLLTFFILVNVFIAIVLDAFEEAKTMTHSSLMNDYLKLRVTKRLRREKKSIKKIRALVARMMVDQAEGEALVDAEEIAAIERELTATELAHWNVLKLRVDEDGSGTLTVVEINALCDLMNQDVAAVLLQEEQLAKEQAAIELSPEHRKIILVQQELGEIKATQAQMLAKLDKLLGTS
jgi:hypothetical protein